MVALLCDRVQNETAREQLAHGVERKTGILPDITDWKSPHRYGEARTGPAAASAPLQRGFSAGDRRGGGRIGNSMATPSKVPIIILDSSPR
jgi:hypothetical protein